MKNLIFILTFLGFTTSLFSQDSIQVRTEIDTFKQSNYEGQFDYVFSRKEPKKQLLKLGAMPNGNNSYFELAYERKIAQNFSVNVILSNTNFGDKIDNFRFSFPNFFKIGIEPRWYYTMKRDIKNGLISDNLNGNYVGLRTNLNYTDNETGPQGQGFNLITELTWGMQRRILRNQYLDLNIGAGFVHRFNKLDESGVVSNQNKWLFNYRFTYGIILDNNLFKKNKTQNCDALRCFEEEKNLWKVGINRAIAANLDGVEGALSIANERKIGNSAWSIETKLGISAFQYKSSKFPQTESYGANLQVMPRFYWDLSKRIAKGESASNLSGKYIGLSMNYGVNHYKSRVPSDPASNGNYDVNIPSASIVPVIGFQKRLLNHLYIDANVGYGVFYKKFATGWDKKSDLSGNFTFGLSF
jgi:hypothetical protein